MCEFSTKLVAWLDRELPEAEAAHVQHHLLECAECRRAVRSYEEISGAFLECYAAAMPVKRTKPWQWLGVSGAAAAAAGMALALVSAYPRAESLQASPPPVHAPALAFEMTPIVAARARRVRKSRPAAEEWLATGPTVEVALPAEALFPPGAVPAGFSYIADIRPQP